MQFQNDQYAFQSLQPLLYAAYIPATAAEHVVFIF